jgi:anti-sigma B factor antagonist
MDSDTLAGRITRPRPGGGRVTDPSASSLHVALRTDDDTVTMVLAGEFDLDAAAYFSARASEALKLDAATLVIDLAGLTFIDSTGVAAVLEIYHRLSAGGRALRVINVCRQPAGVFAMTGLTGSALEIIEDGT